MSIPFELRGEFAGFIRTVLGKRRLILRTVDGDVQLKIPRTLRRQLDGQLHAGCEIAVAGLENRKPGEKVRRVVLGARVLDSSAAGARFSCPIRVCTKKNCWRQGGHELWQAIESELKTIAGAPELEAVDCLDRCKRAPNFDCGDLEFERCTPEHARHFIRDLAALDRPSREQ